MRGFLDGVAAPELRAFGVGAVPAIGAEGDGVLANFGEEDELLGDLAADGAGVGLDRQGGNAAPVEDVGVGASHGVVGALESFLIAIEGVRILHDELTDADQAAARPRLIAEFLLDLVESHRQLAVGLHGPAHEVRDRLFVGGSEDVLVLAPVAQAEEYLAVGFVPAGLAPEFEWLDDRHEEFLGAGGVHFVADNRLDLP